MTMTTRQLIARLISIGWLPLNAVLMAIESEAIGDVKRD